MRVEGHAQAVKELAVINAEREVAEARARHGDMQGVEDAEERAYDLGARDALRRVTREAIRARVDPLGGLSELFGRSAAELKLLADGEQTPANQRAAARRILECIEEGMDARSAWRAVLDRLVGKPVQPVAATILQQHEVTRIVVERRVDVPPLPGDDPPTPLPPGGAANGGPSPHAHQLPEVTDDEHQDAREAAD